MSILRKTSAIALMIAMGGTIAHAQTKPAAKDVVIVHGALADGSGWRAIYDILNKDGFHVTIVQEPLTGLAEDVDATKRVIDRRPSGCRTSARPDHAPPARAAAPCRSSRPPPPSTPPDAPAGDAGAAEGL